MSWQSLGHHSRETAPCPDPAQKPQWASPSCHNGHGRRSGWSQTPGRGSTGKHSWPSSTLGHSTGTALPSPRHTEGFLTIPVSANCSVAASFHPAPCPSLGTHTALTPSSRASLEVSDPNLDESQPQAPGECPCSSSWAHREGLGWKMRFSKIRLYHDIACLTYFFCV